MPSEIEKPNELQVSCSSPPEKMDNETLAAFVVDGVEKIRNLIPYLRELKERFARAPRGKANIAGCPTWQDFCERKLHRTPEAIRQALAPPRLKEPEEPRILLDAIKKVKFAIPADDGKYSVTKAVFRANEDGKVELAATDGHRVACVPFDIPAPKPQLDLRRIAEEIDRYVEEVKDEVEATVLGQPVIGGAGAVLLLKIIEWAEAGFPGLPPFEASLTLKGAKFLARMSGDPTVFDYGLRNDDPYAADYFGYDGTGLRFLYTPCLKAIMKVFEAKYKEARDAESEAQAAQPYTGDFLPNLKVGDEVTIGFDFTEMTRIEEVTAVSSIEITTPNYTFDREGHSEPNRCHILRITTDEDLEAEKEFEAAQEEKQRANEAALATQAAWSQAIEAQEQRIPEKIRRAAEWGYLRRTTRIQLIVTLEQLTKIADALQPESPASEIPTVDCGTSENSENGKE
jgi:hypothetical protein